MRSLFCIVALLAPLMFLSGCATNGRTAGDGGSGVIFSAMGDIPYSAEEDAILASQLQQIDPRSEFIIHLGDIRPGSKGEPCERVHYARVAGILARADRPLFIIPGDNEWNDCPNHAEAWGYWAAHFMRFDERWGNPMGVERQRGREENFAFFRRGVLFIGINLVGGKVHDPDEWRRRMQDDLDWTSRLMRRHADDAATVVIFGHALPSANHKIYFDGLSSAAAQYGKPVLYLHGDGHKWIYDRPFSAKNILRIQVDQGGLAPPITVQATGNPEQPFIIERTLATSRPATTTASPK